MVSMVDVDDVDVSSGFSLGIGTHGYLTLSKWVTGQGLKEGSCNHLSSFFILFSLFLLYFHIWSISLPCLQGPILILMGQGPTQAIQREPIQSSGGPFESKGGEKCLVFSFGRGHTRSGALPWLISPALPELWLCHWN